jgi:hypothetical protein
LGNGDPENKKKNQFSGIPKGTQQSFWGIQVGNETKRCQGKNIGPAFPFF